MTDTTWTPDSPLRWDATDEQIIDRRDYLCELLDPTDSVSTTARELAEAVAAQRVAEVERERDALKVEWHNIAGIVPQIEARADDLQAELAAVTAERDVLKREVVRQRVLLACPHEFNVVPPTDLHPRQFSAYRRNYVRGWMGKPFSTGYGQRSMKQVAARGHDDGFRDFAVAHARALAAEESRSDG